MSSHQNGYEHSQTKDGGGIELERRLENEAVEKASVKGHFPKVATDLITRKSISLGRGYMLKDKSLVSTLWCAICRQYETRICGHENFSWAWIDGSSNHKTSNITEHANSEPHKAAMMYFRKDQAKSGNDPVTSYSPIAHSLLSSASMDPAVRERIKKFDISFVVAKEHIPFLKYPAIHELEERHGVDLGPTYKNRDSARNFVHYIAESQRRQLHVSLASCHFCSVLMDGSADKG